MSDTRDVEHDVGTKAAKRDRVYTSDVHEIISLFSYVIRNSDFAYLSWTVRRE